MKYVIVETDAGKEVAVATEAVVHKLLYAAMCRSIHGPVRPHSAGFFYVTRSGEVQVADRISESLNLGPQPTDAKDIADYLGYNSK